MSSRGQRCRASGLWPQLPQDLLQHHNAGTEGVTIVLDDVAPFADQHFGLYVIQVMGQTPRWGC